MEWPISAMVSTAKCDKWNLSDTSPRSGCPEMSLWGNDFRHGETIERCPDYSDTSFRQVVPGTTWKWLVGMVHKCLGGISSSCFETRIMETVRQMPVDEVEPTVMLKWLYPIVEASASVFLPSKTKAFRCGNKDFVQCCPGSKFMIEVCLKLEWLISLSGVYDRRMGCLEESTDCQTCFENTLHCLGHYGHIDLAPIFVYNPLFYQVRWKTRLDEVLQKHI